MDKLNKLLEKSMPLLTPFSVLMGVALSGVLSAYTSWVPWIFAFMTFAGSLGMNVNDFRRVLLHPFPIFVFLIVLHIIMPLVAWTAGHLAFPGDPYTITGLILLMVIPTGIASMIWVSIYRGHTALTLTMILIDTLLAPLYVPYLMSLLVGEQVAINSWGMLNGLLWMIVLPSFLGMLLNQYTGGKVKVKWTPVLSPLSKISLGIIIAINSSVIAPVIQAWDWGIAYMITVCLVMVALGYIIGWGAARGMKLSRDLVVSMTFNCGMRNISAGAVLAIAYFPPAVAVPAVIGTLFQQLLASIFGSLLFRKAESSVVKEAAHGAKSA
ncbi:MULTISPECIES: bile acid:sodium symporter family protein [unclassified Paenibacillus]|uniref:bile acid:sodium symporter family protein n=1 Tax=unclassified Paenibacillus TaxID=185978 RepID=UPI001AE7C22D|nr:MULTISPECIES: bile acid:sodium symporter family protein [unclassified Paenibacillus]MBP1156729.1 putative Na+-dependent transporter [Paenibacillus sp. PvP091]MBP1172533.1 putative Na+-dependent transporter [Paenibacillus sp. PvR098]MBP2438913.1 putative Na+-dependent transporter [Paenibacillus sp. PvP052]